MDFTYFKQVCGVFLLGLVVFVVTMLMGPGCAHPEMRFQVRSWAGDPSKGGVTRSQEERTVSCTDPKFDQFVCMTYDDLKDLYLSLRKCTAWTD
jgi:hypothetical protein